MKDALYLGIDGGASKTAAVLMDGTGAVRGTGGGPGSAVSGTPSDEACVVLAAAAGGALDEAGVSRGDVARCSIGLNGVDFEDERERQLDVLTARLGLSKERTSLVNDGIVALWGASPAERAAVLQVGSGFTSAFRCAFGGETLFDHLNVGRTLDIRRELTVAVARMIDGRLDRTPLLDAALTHFGIESEEEYADRLFRGTIPPERIADSAALVFAAWREGDPAARAIGDRAVEDYALAAAGMLRRLGAGPADMVFGGGVMQQAPGEFRRALEERVTASFPDARVHPSLLPPEYGAALMAAFPGGEEYPALYGRTKESHDRRRA